MEMIEQFTAVMAVLILLGAAIWFLRRRGLAIPTLPGKTQHRRLEMIERLSLGPQQMLHLVRFGDRALLVASSASGCALLESRPWSESVSSAEVIS